MPPASCFKFERTLIYIAGRKPLTLCVIVTNPINDVEPIKSTAEILAFKVLNRDIDESWITWAIDMLTAGFETEHLIILAGETKPYNQFHLQALTTKVLQELHLDYADMDKTIKNYVCFLIEKIFERECDRLEVLSMLKDLCVELDHKHYLYDFYLLYFAKEDLADSNHQWYWDGADRNNIDTIIDEYLKRWRLSCGA